MLRECLPTRRKSVTHEVTVDGQRVYFTVGKHTDGRIGDLFIDVNKEGTAVRTWATASAQLISLLLQYNVPLKVIAATVKSTGDPVLGAVVAALESEYRPQLDEAPQDNLDLLATILDRINGDDEMDEDRITRAFDQMGMLPVLSSFLETMGYGLD